MLYKIWKFFNVHFVMVVVQVYLGCTWYLLCFLGEGMNPSVVFPCQSLLNKTKDSGWQG